MAGLVAVPIVVTLLSITGSPTPVWSHLKATVLSEYVANSLIINGAYCHVLAHPGRLYWLADWRLLI